MSNLFFLLTNTTGYTECEVYPYVYLNEERCDGILQCPNGDDEVDCGKSLTFGPVVGLAA